MLYVLEKDVWSLVRTEQFKANVSQSQAIYVTGIQAIGRRRTSLARLRIVGTLLTVGSCYLLSSATILNPDV